MDMDKICFGCFNECTTDVCPHCGFVRNSEQPLLALPLGTILAGRYMTGKVLGMGGFGVTYLGYDLTLQTKVAIKEYLPSGMAARGTDRYTMTVITSNDSDSYVSGQDKFLEEARILAKLQNVPNIVSVQNYFKENNTAYFVMSYIDGMSLKTYLEQHGGRLTYDETLRILKPIMDALCSVHALNLLHRDISTDNIYITAQGESKLLDFGAARFALGDEKSVSVILKHGYAPEEQYRSHGNQGPWTDVYAMGATFYNCITGSLPPDSIDRLHADAIIPPRQMGVQITAGQEAALMRALAVHAENRFSNMRDMADALCGNTSTAGGWAAGSSVAGPTVGGPGQTYGRTSATPGTYQTSMPGNMTQQSAPGGGSSFAGFINRLKTDRKMLIIVSSACAAVIIAIILMIVLIPKRTNTAGGGTGSQYSSASAPTTGSSSSTLTPTVTPTPSSSSGSTLSKDTSSGTSTDTSAGDYKTTPYSNQTFGFSIDVIDGYTTQENTENSYISFTGDNTALVIYYAFYSGVPIYSLEDFENNTDKIMASMTDTTSPTITQKANISINGKPSYAVGYETDEAIGVVAMVETGEGYGGYFLCPAVKKSVADAEARMDELSAMLATFTVTGTLVSNASLYESTDLGFKFLNYPSLCTPTTQFGQEGKIDCAFLRYDETDTSNEIEIEKADTYGTDPESAMAALNSMVENAFTASNNASFTAGDLTTSTDYGDYEVLERVYTVTYNNSISTIRMTSAEIEGQTYVVASFYDADHADSSDTMMNVVLCTLRPI